MKEYLLMGDHNSMLVTYRSYFKILLKSKFLISMKMNTLWQIMKSQYQLPHHHLSFKKLIKSRRKKKRRFTPTNHPLKGLWRWVKWIYIGIKFLVSNSFWKVSSLEEPSFLEDMEKIQREMCNIKGNFMSLIFDRKVSLSLVNGYMNPTWIIMKLFRSSQFKMSNFLKSCKTLVFPPMFQIVKW